MPCFLLDAHDKEERFQHFADELEVRLRSPVDVETIDWIWDEIERLSNNGKRYSDDFRPVRNGQLKEPDGTLGWPGRKSAFVSSAHSTVFHKAGCASAAKIPWRDRIDYGTREMAIESGKRPCAECRP
jgi:hypothetical protein